MKWVVRLASRVAYLSAKISYSGSLSLKAGPPSAADRDDLLVIGVRVDDHVDQRRAVLVERRAQRRSELLGRLDAIGRAAEPLGDRRAVGRREIDARVGQLAAALLGADQGQARIVEHHGGDAAFVLHRGAELADAH